MTTDHENEDSAAEESGKDAPGNRQEHEFTKTVDPKIAAEMADRAAERAESEAREGRTEP